MSALTMDLEIWFEGKAEPVPVRADQREISQFELKYRVGFTKALDEMPITFYRALGYGAAKRLGKVDPSLSEDAWLATVISVGMADDQDEPADPGHPEA